MTVLEWDKIGDRIYQTGIDRGVLYLKDGTSVPWNGLTSVEDASNSELKSYYLDGVKILDHVTPGDFEGKLKAITYPEEFEQVVGSETIDAGLIYYNQPFKSFNLSYRTKVGNDLEGPDYGYKIHLFYNLIANPDSVSYESLNDKSSSSEFSWTLSGVPPIISGHKPTAHVSIDSTQVSSEIIEIIEAVLYGTNDTDPHFPTFSELREYYTADDLTIIDHGDGTWTAVDLGNDYITMIDGTTFQIDHSDATYSDTVTYEISNTETPLP